MLDLARLSRDLESPAYGTLAHAVDVLMEVIDAHASIAQIMGMPRDLGRVYVDTRGPAISAEHRRALRKWPSDPRSPFRRLPFLFNTDRDDACLLDPSAPADRSMYGELARELNTQDGIAGAMCLRLSVAKQTPCLMLFVRLDGHEPFVHGDLDRIRRFASAAGRVIQQGHRHQLVRDGLAPTINRRLPGTLPIDDLLDRLSGTERRVLQRLRMGETERQTAQALDRSPHTVHVHIKSIYRKLMISSRSELFAMLDRAEHPRTPVPMRNDHTSPMRP